MQVLSGLVRGLAVALAAMVVFGLSAAVGAETASRDHILPGVVVLGVPVGGLTADEAAARLAGPSAAILDRSLDIQVGDRVWTTTPRGLGLKLEPAELADAAFQPGHGGSPTGDLRAHLMALTTQTVIPVGSTSDGAALDQLLQRIASDIDTSPRSASLDLGADGTVTFQPSQTGLQLERARARGLIADAMAAGEATVTLPTRTLPPAVDTAQVATAHDTLVRVLANPAPLQLQYGQQRWTLERDQLVAMLTLHQPADGNPASVELDTSPVQTLLQTIASQVDQPPQDARFTLDGSQLSLLRPSHDGRALNQQAALDAIRDRILAGERGLDLPVEVARPAVAAEDAPSLGIRELIGESTTSFANSIPEKAHNIRLAAERLNGVVVPPGSTFSFNKEVGPTTLEAGFQWGFGLTGGQGGVHTVPSVAGGICQVATTLFQPVFWSGYQLEERYWHLYWIPAYTSRGVVGLDATVDADSGLDLKWTNTTQTPVLIQSSTDPEHITFRLYGQKPPWTVQVDEPVVFDRIAPDTTPQVQEEPTLPWGRTLLVETARDGFSVILNRHVTPTAGGQPRDLALKSVYAPAHTVTLVGTGGAPSASSIAAAVGRARGSQGQSSASAAAPPPSAAAQQPAPAAEPAPAPEPTPAQPETYETPNGPRTMTQMRDELRVAGWGGGSDQDALATYLRVTSGR